MDDSGTGHAGDLGYKRTYSVDICPYSNTFCLSKQAVTTFDADGDDDGTLLTLASRDFTPIDIGGKCKPEMAMHFCISQYNLIFSC